MSQTSSTSIDPPPSPAPTYAEFAPAMNPVLTSNPVSACEPLSPSSCDAGDTSKGPDDMVEQNSYDTDSGSIGLDKHLNQSVYDAPEASAGLDAPASQLASANADLAKADSPKPDVETPTIGNNEIRGTVPKIFRSP